MTFKEKVESLVQCNINIYMAENFMGLKRGEGVGGGGGFKSKGGLFEDYNLQCNPQGFEFYIYQ